MDHFTNMANPSILSLILSMASPTSFCLLRKMLQIVNSVPVIPRRWHVQKIVITTAASSSTLTGSKQKSRGKSESSKLQEVSCSSLGPQSRAVNFLLRGLLKRPSPTCGHNQIWQIWQSIWSIHQIPSFKKVQINLLNQKSKVQLRKRQEDRNN